MDCKTIEGICGYLKGGKCRGLLSKVLRVKNWVRFLLHFPKLETRSRSMPTCQERGIVPASEGKPIESIADLWWHLAGRTGRRGDEEEV